MTKQYKKDYFEDRKLKYEKNHGVFVHEFMFTEFSNRIIGQCNASLNDLQRQLDVEIARAKAEEERLDGKIDTEKTRLDGKIDEKALSNLNQINKLLTYSNLYNSLTYDINEIADNSKIEYTSIMFNGNSYETLSGSETPLNEILNSTFNAVATALNQINKKLKALENK